MIQPRTGLSAMCEVNENEAVTDEDTVEEAKEATLLKKRKGKFVPHKVKDNRDRLLYSVTEVTPPKRTIGEYRLDANAGCGDMICVGEETFVIQKVGYRYVYVSGAYRMVGKQAYVKKASREGTESFLERMLDTKVEVEN